VTTRTAPRTKQAARAPSARGPLDPRVRERWIAARRSEGRRRLRILLSLSGVVVVLVVAAGVMASPLLDVDRVVVKGSIHTTPAEVERAAGVHPGDMMVLVDTGAAAQGIDALPWIRSARVEREWPGTVTIAVTERSPVGWVDTGHGPAFVDRTGRVLELLSAAPADLPQIMTPKVVPPVGATITPTVGANVAGALQGFARSGTRTITVTPGGVVLGLVNGPDLRLGEPTHVDRKVRAAIAVLTALDGEAVQYIDVTVPSNPVAGPPV
jgi:cell division protein FtsQ